MNIRTVAFFSTMPDLPNYLSADAKRILKLTYLSRALSILLQPLKQASFSGILLQDPHGNLQNTYPRVLSYVMDSPEVSDILCIKSAPAPFPCEQCWAPFNNLGDITKCYNERTEQTQQQLLGTLMRSRNAPRQGRDARLNSLPPVPSGLWGFKNQSSGGPGNILLVVGFESMHNEDLGITLYIVNNIKPHLMKRLGDDIRRVNLLLKELNDRMAELPRTGKSVT
jgi:hypothetical protein